MLTYIYMGKLGPYWPGSWFGAPSAPSQYLHKWWFKVFRKKNINGIFFRIQAFFMQGVYFKTSSTKLFFVWPDAHMFAGHVRNINHSNVFNDCISKFASIYSRNQQVKIDYFLFTEIRFHSHKSFQHCPQRWMLMPWSPWDYQTDLRSWWIGGLKANPGGQGTSIGD